MRALTPMRWLVGSIGVQCVVQPHVAQWWRSSVLSPQRYVTVAPVTRTCAGAK